MSENTERTTCTERWINQVRGHISEEVLMTLGEYYIDITNEQLLSTSRVRGLAHDKSSDLYFRIEIKVDPVHTILNIERDIVDPDSGEVVAEKGDVVYDPDQVDLVLCVAAMILEYSINNYAPTDPEYLTADDLYSIRNE